MSREEANFHDIAAWCKAEARKGAARLRATTGAPNAKPERTPTEELAVVRKRADEEAKR